MERLLDGLVIFTLLFVAIMSPGFPAEELPHDLVGAMRGSLAVLAVALAGALLVVSFPVRSLLVAARLFARLPPGRIAAGLERVMEGVVEGLASMRGWRLMLPALAWTFCVWLLQSVSFWFGFMAFDIRLPFAAALLANAVVAFAAALPATPGYVGTLQAAVSVALVQVYGVGTRARPRLRGRLAHRQPSADYGPRTVVHPAAGDFAARLPREGCQDGRDE